jgi:uncharacterized membrane protein
VNAPCEKQSIASANMKITPEEYAEIEREAQAARRKQTNNIFAALIALSFILGIFFPYAFVLTVALFFGMLATSNS